MKRLLLIFAVVFSIGISSAHAQRYMPGAKAIELKAGFVDGFSTKSFYSSLGLSGYTKRHNRWYAGVEYLEKGFIYKQITVPKVQITSEGGYYLMFLSDYSKTICVSVGALAIAGYETLNWGNSTLYNGAELSTSESLIYGGALALEIETFITDKIVFLLNAKQRVMWGGSLSMFHSQIGAGLKFIIN